jgi:cytosine/adenosine deaminase-related metal-dependent hydrolase
MAGNHADIARQFFLYCGSNMSLRLDATIASPESALEMATINGARALGIEADTGSIETGKSADITLFNALASDWVPVINPVGNLAFSSRGGAHTVIAGGVVLMRDGLVQTLDEAAVLANVQVRAEALAQRSGLARFCQPAWPVE